jgi:hypothetical protein
MFGGLGRVGRGAVIAGVAGLSVAGSWNGASAAVRAESAPAGTAANGTVKVRVLGLGNVTSDPAGITCGPDSTCEAPFTIGTRLTLSPTAASPGWVFHVWDPAGPCAAAKTTPTCTFTVSSSFQEVAPLFVGLTLNDISFAGKWSRSILTGGSVTVAGLVSHTSNLVVTATGPSKRTFPLNLPAGDFQQTFKLPKTGFFPGSYTVTVAGTVTGHVIPPQTLTRELPVPKEGVVAKAWISAFGGSAPVARLPASAIGATAHFVFAANPFKGSAVTATWFRNNKKFFGPVGKPRTKNITSFVGVRGGHLPRGFYTCVLKARGLVVKQVGIQVG